MGSCLHVVQNGTKNQCGKFKKFQDFCLRDIESGCEARETVIAKCELVLQGTASPIYYMINLIRPLKHYLAENSSLQRSNCNSFGFTDTGLIR